MKRAEKLLKAIACALVASSLMMCSKPTLKVDKPLSVVSETSPVKTDTVKIPVVTSPTAGADITMPDTSLSVRVTNAATTSITVKPNQWYVDGSTLPAGAVIYIQAGTRGALLLKNIQGTVQQPVIVVNQGGQVTFSTSATASYAFKTQNCKYFKVLGNGEPTIKYGFVMDGGNISVSMDDFSSDFEISNIEVKNSGFAGIMAKTDPSCDPATWRGAFTMTNVVIHHNYIHNTGGEGIYIGNSFYEDGMATACGTVKPHDIKNLKVYKNTIISSGCEGIQVGSAISGCYVYYNTVLSPGRSPFASGQNNGIQIGEGTGGKCYNNLVKDAPGNGIIVLGLGDNTIFNNYIINAGEHGIFADSRYTPGPYFRFINNTIIEPKKDGIKLNSESIPMNYAINNVIIKPGSGLAIHRMSNDVKLTQSNNYVNNDVNAVKFVDYAGGNYHLDASSPLIKAGLNTYSYGVTVDYYGVRRLATSVFGIGATEYP
ncbi:right-handed parallel beta-helix repeat-containing protein [Mucilaginibacter conchicola]|uniref:Right-handed parallel beta-helix repeat-containing protein n=1 Tax=Mucilaginibacter conchicola TaxID=2303333 RepID=A0A372NPF7_9SPHI|nr:right-handed parallel beta-helix repeat-containing protein [Mucilaginibacter conchicola]RFZ90811.1 right-handed parallel beta-helix repeat-containing protein [Mucilaginibacter conchicola]